MSSSSTASATRKHKRKIEGPNREEMGRVVLHGTANNECFERNDSPLPIDLVYIVWSYVGTAISLVRWAMTYGCPNDELLKSLFYQFTIRSLRRILWDNFGLGRGFWFEFQRAGRTAVIAGATMVAAMLDEMWVDADLDVYCLYSHHYESGLPKFVKAKRSKTYEIIHDKYLYEARICGVYTLPPFVVSNRQAWLRTINLHLVDDEQKMKFNALNDADGFWLRHSVVHSFSLEFMRCCVQTTKLYTDSSSIEMLAHQTFGWQNGRKDQYPRTVMERPLKSLPTAQVVSDSHYYKQYIARGFRVVDPIVMEQLRDHAQFCGWESTPADKRLKRNQLEQTL